MLYPKIKKTEKYSIGWLISKKSFIEYNISPHMKLIMHLTSIKKSMYLRYIKIHNMNLKKVI